MPTGAEQAAVIRDLSAQGRHASFSCIRVASTYSAYNAAKCRSTILRRSLKAVRLSKRLAKYITSIVMLAASVVAGACSRMQDKQMTVGKVTYKFPAEHVSRFIDSGEGHPYARLRPPEQPFDLVYDEFAKYRRNFKSTDAPLVATINDRSISDHKRFNFPGGVTVCKESQPYYSCGLNIVDEGIEWSVLFNKQQVDKSESIRASAAALLRAYRS